jgi:hypothetical protein
MFISKNELENMRYKLTALENAVARLEMDTQMWYPNYPIGYTSKAVTLGNFRGNDHILLVDIVKKIMDHIGINITRPTQRQEPFTLNKISKIPKYTIDEKTLRECLMDGVHKSHGKATPVLVDYMINSIKNVCNKEE